MLAVLYAIFRKLEATMNFRLKQKKHGTGGLTMAECMERFLKLRKRLFTAIDEALKKDCGKHYEEAERMQNESD